TSIHPPEHCLPGAGWDVIDARVINLDVPGLPVKPNAHKEAKRFVIAKGDQRRLVYFWYQSRGRTIARNQEVILYRFWDRATRHRTDGALVRLTVPIFHQDEADAEATLLEFVTGFAPLLSPYTPS
ncbi:MAG: exosortase C-terminal domain/associated protein EpsI, partial [Myxococcota bacterium]